MYYYYKMYNINFEVKYHDIEIALLMNLQKFDITFYTPYKKWRVQICIKSKNTHVGYYNKIEDAIAAYNNAATKNYGEFAYINKV